MKQGAHAPRLSITSIATRNACPICLALREFQTDLLKHLKPEECLRFCNTHGWVVANSAPAESAITIFLRAFGNPEWRSASPLPEQCDLCKKVQEEKEQRLSETAAQFQDPTLRSWLHDYGTLCSRHAREVMTRLPEVLRKKIEELIARNREEITGILEEYLEHVKKGSHAGGGILGRAAEFLVAYRGIES
jgi:hypothetical protein